MRYPLLLAVCLVGVAACTDVKENFPEGGCVPNSVKCDGPAQLLRCVPGGTHYELFKTCAADSECGGDPADCTAVAAAGPTCESDGECAAQLGDLGLCFEAWCDAGTCKARAIADGSSCDDRNACTDADICTQGVCAGTLVACDDGDACTADSCDPVEGCQTVIAEGALCDDTNPCTDNDTCDSAGACAGTGVSCDDSNPCTEDQCDAATGECVNIALSGACDDDDACTANDKCVAGVCLGSPDCPCESAVPGSCDKYNTDDPCKGAYACVNDFCEPDPGTAFQCDQSGLGGCEVAQCINNAGVAECAIISKEPGTPCEDGSPCTTGDTCQDGVCEGVQDNTVPGCGFFRIGWYSMNGESMTWTTDQYILRGTVGYPQIVGKAQNDTYRVIPMGTGL